MVKIQAFDSPDTESESDKTKLKHFIDFSICYMPESKQSTLVGQTSLGLSCSFALWLVGTSKQNLYMTWEME